METIALLIGVSVLGTASWLFVREVMFSPMDTTESVDAANRAESAMKNKARMEREEKDKQAMDDANAKRYADDIITALGKWSTLTSKMDVPAAILATRDAERMKRGLPCEAFAMTSGPVCNTSIEQYKGDTYLHIIGTEDINRIRTGICMSMANVVYMMEQRDQWMQDRHRRVLDDIMGGDAYVDVDPPDPMLAQKALTIKEAVRVINDFNPKDARWKRLPDTLPDKLKRAAIGGAVGGAVGYAAGSAYDAANTEEAASASGGEEIGNALGGLFGG